MIIKYKYYYSYQPSPACFPTIRGREGGPPNHHSGQFYRNYHLPFTTYTGDYHRWKLCFYFEIFPPSLIVGLTIKSSEETRASISLPSVSSLVSRRRLSVVLAGSSRGLLSGGDQLLSSYRPPAPTTAYCHSSLVQWSISCISPYFHWINTAVLKYVVNVRSPPLNKYQHKIKS